MDLPLPALIAIYAAAILVVVFLIYKLTFARSSGPLRLSGGKERRLLKKAEKLVAKEEYDQAAELLAGMTDASADPQVRRLLISTQLKREHFSLALMEINRFFDRFGPELDNNEKISLLYQRADMHEKLGEYDEAARDLQDVYQLDNREHDKVFMRTGICCFRQKEYDKALTLFQKSRENPQDDPLLVKYFGIIFYKKQDYAHALEYLKKAQVHDRKDAEVRLYLGRIYLAQAKYNDAEIEFKAVLRERQQRLSALHSLAETYSGMGKKADAVMMYETGLKEIKHESDDTLKFRYDAAALYEEKKEFQNALDQWRIISDVEPDYMDIQERIARNARFGHDRISDFKVKSQSDFEGTCRNILNYFEFSFQRKIRSESDMVDYHVADKRNRDLLLRVYRGDAPAGKRLMEEFHKLMEDSKFEHGIVLSASGVVPNAGQYILDKDITVMGTRQLMKALKYYELTHSR